MTIEGAEFEFSALDALDASCRRVLQKAAERQIGPIGPADVLAAVLQLEAPDVLACLSSAIRPGTTVRDMKGLMEVSRHREAPGWEKERGSTGLREALLDSRRLLADVSPGRQQAGLPLFLACILRRWTAADGPIEQYVDLDRAAAALVQLARQWQGEPQEGKESASANVKNGAADAQSPTAAGAPFELPEGLPPSIDLTNHVRRAPPGDSWTLGEDAQGERLFDAVLRALHRRAGHHVLLVGERGVGLPAVLAELARRGVCGASRSLEDRRIISVDCRFVAPEESRAVLVRLLQAVAEHERLIVAVDRFARLLRGAGGSNKPLLLSMLARAKCRLIGLMEPREYDELVADDLDFREFFARADVPEPDLETAQRLAGRYAAGLAAQFDLTIEPAAIERAVVLTANYVFSERLPGKAVRILHRVCEDVDYERTQRGSTQSCVTASDVVRAVSEASGVPEETLRGVAERSDYERSLAEVIVGQPAAIAEVATELGLIKSGLTDGGKPASVMLFVGQTGTGKTEMAKALARLYSASKRLKTYTLGNFVEPHSVAGIIGVPPGYVGHDAGGQLVNDLNSDPYGVFLLDEADKAHPDVLQPFLNLFDEGWLVDQRGVKAYANHAVFILTTNVGQKVIADMAAKGSPPHEIAARIKETLAQLKHPKAQRPVFAPEFLARIKRVIVFNPLDAHAMLGIARNQFIRMQHEWRLNRGKQLDVPEALIDRVGQRANELNERSKGKEGGRIVRKLTSDLVESKIQRAISDAPQDYHSSRTVALSVREAVDHDDLNVGVDFVA